MLKWFREEKGTVAILDATNSTKERRKWILEICTNAGIEVIYVESKCDDEELIMANIRDVKTTSPDYKGQDPEQAAMDFRNRIRNYEKVYKTVNEDGDEDHLTYLKILDVGKQVIINRIQDYLQSRVVYYLMNLHIRPRSVWLSRVSPLLVQLRGSRLGMADTIVARRIRVQPRRKDWRRRTTLSTRGTICAQASRAGPRVSGCTSRLVLHPPHDALLTFSLGRPSTHGLDIYPEADHRNGASSA
jgi:hypothetical protein